MGALVLLLWWLCLGFDLFAVGGLWVAGFCCCVVFLLVGVSVSGCFWLICFGRLLGGFGACNLD